MSTSELVETNLADIPAATEATLIETVLGSPGIAEKILIANGLVGIARMSPVALAERAGISVKEAHRLVAAFELGHRVEIARTRRPKRLRTSRDIATFFGPTLRGLVHEEVWIAGLDAWQGVRGVRMVARGGLHGATLRPADVLRGALELAAVSFVLCHNHPSGDPKPTDEDIVMTNEIEHRAHLIGVELVDHVVVCPNGKYASVFRR
ncbi:JAB domain-containing protein [Sorangium sp. So ce388]|uniref:JAB domain-containing protein n=1 Tax=Sorangium sp. So ce388 TaxID=3133309 RepID=UPI003F5C7546